MQIKEVRDFCIDVVRYFSDSGGFAFFFFSFDQNSGLVTRIVLSPVMLHHPWKQVWVRKPAQPTL